MEALVSQRLIPAHAGKTLNLVMIDEAWAAHPRSRGENDSHRIVGDLQEGSSPLTRGKLGNLGHTILLVGLIPAHAGKTLPDLRFYCADRSDLGNP